MAPSATTIPPPRRIVASNHDLPAGAQEPGVEVLVETLKTEAIFGGTFGWAQVSSHGAVPTSNEGTGPAVLEQGADTESGIVRRNGLNMYFLDLAPGQKSPMHRTESTDYLVVLRGTLTLNTPPKAFDVKDDTGTFTEPEKTVAHEGDIVVQRGIMHALENRTSEWVRALAVVVHAKPNQVSLGEEGRTKELGEVWLQS